MNIENSHLIERPPVVAVMGHIDHGKSTLLSYIRKSIAPLNEAGGITQHISAYEVEHNSKEGKIWKITFLDTPGHEAFSGIRIRGAYVADIAILVVSAEDGVKPQTLEALSSIKSGKTPYIVAINKIDKPEANIERTKQSLAENEIYIEGYGGDIPAVSISAKTGEGVSELLDMIILVAELQNLTGDREISGEGVVIESNLDIKKGISATGIIKNGSIKKGMYIAAGTASAPVRIMENYMGKQLNQASFSSPVKIIGWDELPQVGSIFHTYKTRDEAHEYAEGEKQGKIKTSNGSKKTAEEEKSFITTIPIIVKADTGSSLEAVLSQVDKIKNDQTYIQVLSSGIGTISENDVRLANGSRKAVVVGFNVGVDSPAKNLAVRNEIEIKNFDIIYKMSQWLEELLVLKTPKTKVEESTGVAKILKIFSRVKDKQILGGRVEKGVIRLGTQVKIMRRDAEIGFGKVRELQVQKVKSPEAVEGKEFGVMIEAKVEIAPGDHIESFIIVEK